jgi:peroxiredoxin
MNLNAPAPDFLLPDLDGQFHRLGDYRGQVVVILFWSAECGWSEQADSELQKTSGAWQGRVFILRVAANVHETDAMLRDASHAREVDMILKDSAGQVADLYEAQTTPHCFVIDANGILRYRGAFDSCTFRQRTATKFYLREAVEALLAGRLPEVQETQPYGCTIVREI